jgi:hypothetical protein
MTPALICNYKLYSFNYEIVLDYPYRRTGDIARLKTYNAFIKFYLPQHSLRRIAIPDTSLFSLLKWMLWQKASGCYTGNKSGETLRSP